MPLNEKAKANMLINTELLQPLLLKSLKSPSPRPGRSASTQDVKAKGELKKEKCEASVKTGSSMTCDNVELVAKKRKPRSQQVDVDVVTPNLT